MNLRDLLLRDVLKKYKKGTLKFDIHDYNNECTNYWFTSGIADGVKIWPHGLWITRDIWIDTECGRKTYSAFRWGILRELFDELDKRAKEQSKIDIGRLITRLKNN